MSEEATGATQAVAIPAQLLTNPTPSQMLMLAIERGDGLDKLERLMSLQQQWEAGEARKRFNAAFSAFKAEAVTVLKSVTIKDGPLKGKRHADLHDVVSVVTPKLSAFGLALSWQTTKDERDWMEVTCQLRHVDGHIETETMGGGPDTGPGRNAIQARGSTRTYLQRYTAMAILGLAAKEQDDDGRRAGEPGEPALITPAQVQELEREVKRLGADRAGFLRYINCDSFDQIWAVNFDGVMGELRRKKGMAGGKGGTSAPQRKSAQAQASAPLPSHADRVAELARKADVVGVGEGQIVDRYNVAELFELTFEQIEDALAWLGRIHAG
jgi:hypothetical protein